MERDLVLLEHAAYRHHLAEAGEARRVGDALAESHHRAQALLAAKRLRQYQARPLAAMSVGA